MKVIEASQLTKRYGVYTAVDSIDVAVQAGEYWGLLGPNGAGKTTCFYMIVGLIPCAEGTITLDDIDLTRQPMHVRARHGLGYLPQEASIFRKMTVAENILAVLEIRKGLDRQRRHELLESLMEELHVTHLRDQSGISLSGGERRRVEIARALAAEPRFILLDEPFAGVDPISVLDIQQIIKHLCNRNIGVLITDHNVRETLGICDHAYILNKGQVIAEGPPQTILENQQVRDVYLGAEFRL